MRRPSPPFLALIAIALTGCSFLVDADEARLQPGRVADAAVTTDTPAVDAPTPDVPTNDAPAACPYADRQARTT